MYMYMLRGVWVVAGSIRDIFAARLPVNSGVRDIILEERTCAAGKH